MLSGARLSLCPRCLQVEWNKGHALAHLLSSLDLGDTADVVPIYVGDDRTDEDAFAVLNQRQNGVGILVSTKVTFADCAWKASMQSSG